MRKLASDSVIYGLGSVANQALSFLLLPLYTRYLPPEDYGTLALISAVGGVIGLFATLGIQSGVVRIFFLYDQPRERAAVVGTAWIFAILSSAVVGMALWLGTPWIAPFALDVPGGELYFRYAVVLNAMLAIGAVALATLQAYQRPRPYILSTLSGLVVAAVVTIGLVAFAGRGIEGVLQGQIAGVGVQLVLSFAAAAPGFVPTLRSRPLSEMLAFCVPLLPTNIAAWGLSLADRWFLKSFSTLADVGLYALGYRFGTVLDTIFLRPFQQAWFPYLFSILRDPGHPAVCARVLDLYTAGGGTLVLALALFSSDVIRWISDPSYQGADTVVLWIGIGVLLRGMTAVTVAGIQIHRKTHYSAVVYIGGALLNVGLLAALVPGYGMSGAAWATVGTYLAITLTLYAIAQRLHPIPYRLDRVGLLLGAVIALALVGRATAMLDPVVALPVKIALWLALPAGLLAGRFFRPEEIAAGRALVRRVVGA